ncbi:MAG: hypothetical protein KBD83_08735 [Gammaproteobacteria bacterium]|nr:hypothetical protein [Gammaproteobacteria bacterium]
MKRNEIKSAHENSVLESFKKHCATSNHIVEIISKPEPPDAIITINGNKTWIEITDAFFSSELAESITTHAANNKTHKPVPIKKRFAIEPDEQFSNALQDAIIKKYNKISIGKIYQQYGSGILLVGVINPFSSIQELIATEKEKILAEIKSKESRFNAIYLYCVSDHVFYKLL